MKGLKRQKKNLYKLIKLSSNIKDKLNLCKKNAAN